MRFCSKTQTEVMFSRSCQYALQAVLYICLHGEDGTAVKIKAISESQSIPGHFLGKILQLLVKQKILVSTKGPNGGFLMHQNQEDLTMFDIVRVIDGLDIFDQCGIGLKECSDNDPCPIHHDYKSIKKKIKKVLKRKTIRQLCKDVEKGESIVSFIQ